MGLITSLHYDKLWLGRCCQKTHAFKQGIKWFKRRQGRGVRGRALPRIETTIYASGSGAKIRTPGERIYYNSLFMNAVFLSFFLLYPIRSQICQVRVFAFGAGKKEPPGRKDVLPREIDGKLPVSTKMEVRQT